MIEYCLILSVILIGCVAAVKLLGNSAGADSNRLGSGSPTGGIGVSVTSEDDS